MANRSDFNSILPRQIKRLLALTTYANDKEERAIRELFLEAHSHHKRARVRRLAARDVSNSGDSAD